jgi:hypothetical protein
MGARLYCYCACFGRENWAPQLDYALAVPGHQEVLKFWRPGIKSSGPSLSRSWKLSTMQITQPENVVEILNI